MSNIFIFRNQVFYDGNMRKVGKFTLRYTYMTGIWLGKLKYWFN